MALKRQWDVFGCRKDELKAIRDGFFDPSLFKMHELLKMLMAENLQLMVCGSPVINREELCRSLKFVRFEERSQVPQFLEIIISKGDSLLLLRFISAVRLATRRASEVSALRGGIRCSASANSYGLHHNISS